MKYKEFVAWCNERACDGCWELKEAIICINIIREINKEFFWKREKLWRKHPLYEPIHKYISEVERKKGIFIC